MSGRTVVVPHLGRVEGHGGIVVRLSGNTVTEVDMTIHEGSRYYERLLVGRRYDEVQGLIARVCAICSASHSVAALEALEQALGVRVSPRVQELRGLLVLGSTIESHALHVFALALPDFLGHGSVMEMAAEHRETVTFALNLKQLGNGIQALVGGRAIHPINTLVGGFGKIPSHRELAELRGKLQAALPPLMEAVDLVAGLPVPDWAGGPPVFVALEPYEEGFRFRGSTLVTSRGERIPVARYESFVHERAVAHSHAKHATLDGDQTYMVGSLARLVLHGDRLGGRAAEAVEKLFPRGIGDNILTNTHAQLAELVHCVEHAVELVERLLDRPEVPRELVEYELAPGRGIGALEAPRGVLIHDYTLDGEGVVTAANIVTPTAQNLANVERDLREAAERLLELEPADDGALKLGLEMVARAYDPCISCSVHVIRDGA